MRRKLFVACMLSGLMAFLIQPAFAQTSASLAGSWQLTLVASGTTAQVAGLANFTSDGGAVATAGGILVGPVGPASTTSTTALNPAFGNWNGCCAAGTGAAIKLVSLVTNAYGTLHATRTFQATVTVSADGTEFSGTYSVETVVGTVVILGSGSISGTLIPHFTPPSS